MDRLTLFHHRGKKMMHLDLSGLKPPDYAALVEQATRIITSAAQGSQLVATTVTGARFDNATTALMGRFIRTTNPYLKGNAIIGATGLQKVAVIALRPFWKAPMDEFPDLAAATDWLAGL
ncbi:MAG TPA: hypothetical protein VFM45_04970 [Anaeromyxobacteraceae bacterium]|nr:hypothetical protein [Anaeromyxobacteraceae bacterium]